MSVELTFMGQRPRTPAFPPAPIPQGSNKNLIAAVLRAADERGRQPWASSRPADVAEARREYPPVHGIQQSRAGSESRPA